MTHLLLVFMYERLFIIPAFFFSAHYLYTYDKQDDSQETVIHPLKQQPRVEMS